MFGDWTANLRQNLNTPFAADGTVVETIDLSVEFAGTPVLGAISMALEPGTCLGIRGVNGAGKTTLLRAVCVLQRPTSGQVLVFGATPDGRSSRFRRLVSGMLAVPPLAADMTLIEHLALIGTTWGKKAGEAQRDGINLLDRFNVGYISQRFPGELSSGERQVLAISMALCRPSKLLVLDEPDRHLDTERVNFLSEALSEYQNNGGTILIATHNSQLINAMSAEVFELHRP